MIESSCERKEDITGAADSVWKLLADFGNIGEWWPGGLEKVVNHGEGVGMIREIHNAAGGVISEKLVELDSDQRRIALTIVGEGPAGIHDYLARGTVTEIAPNRCRLEWISSFRVPSEDHVEPAQAFLGAGYKAMFLGLEQAVALATSGILPNFWEIQFKVGSMGRP